MMLKHILYKLLLLSFLIFYSCEKKTRSRSGLIVYQEVKSSWVRNFNPLAPGGVSRWPTSSGIYEPLFIYNSVTSEYIPWLAKNYFWSNNNKTLTVIIKNGITWSDRIPFNAADVEFTFNIKKTFPALDGRSSWSYLDGVYAISDTSVQFQFKRIYVPGFDDLVMAPIVPKHIWEKIDDPVKFPNTHPVGTGPFTEILRFDNQLWELGKNLNYWQKGKPKIDKLVFPTFPSNEQVTLALLSGNLDWAGAFIPAIDRVYVEKNPEHHKYWFPQTGHTTFFYLNTMKSDLENKNVRKAISYAINRNLIVEVGMYGYTVPAHVTAISGPMKKWVDPDVENKENWVSYDPKTSEQLLDDAGYKKNNDGYRIGKDGSILSFDIIIVSGWSDWIRSAQIISANLKEIGILSKVKTYDYGAWYSRMQKGDFEMAIGWTEKGPTPFALYRGMMSSKYVQPIGEPTELNWHRFGLPEADVLFKQFEQTSNEKEQLRIMHQLQHLFIEHAPSIPLFAEASWAECNTKYFTNFPGADNPYATLSPNYPPENLLVLTNVEKR